MILCPIAIVSGCRKCPLFKICPLKSMIGDFKKTIAAEKNDDEAGVDKSNKAGQ